MKSPTRAQATAAVIAAARQVDAVEQGHGGVAEMAPALKALRQALDDLDAIEEQTRQSKQAQTNLSRGYGGKGR
jgi:Na+/H+-translocating membrane pyrophosphatase